MAGNLNFSRKFADYGEDVRDFERSPAVLRVLTEIVNDLSQTISAYTGGFFSSIWLHGGDQPGSEADLDLIFVNQEDGYLDIILRQEGTGTVRAGFFLPSETIRVTDEIVNGLRVVVGTEENGSKTRYEFDGNWYQPVGPAFNLDEISPERRKNLRILTPT